MSESHDFRDCVKGCYMYYMYIICIYKYYIMPDSFDDCCSKYLKMCVASD